MSTDSCTLCGLPTGSDPYTDPDVAGEYCCRGCLAVSRSLGTIEDGERIADDVRSAVEDERRSAVEDERRSEQVGRSPASGGDWERTYLHIDGMHCTVCERFLERVAADKPGIGTTAASYATDTMRVEYDPDVLDRDELLDTLTLAGYEANDIERRREPSTGDDIDVVRFLIGGGFFGMMTMLWYVLFLYPTYFGYEPFLDFGGFDGLYLFFNIFVFTSIVLLYTGYPILRGAYVSLSAGQPNMDLLVALAATSAYLYSTITMLVGGTDLYFDVTVAIILVVTAGNHYESIIKKRAVGLLSDLRSQQATTARLTDGETIPIEAIEPGDRLLVNPGERIPVDGTVVEGMAAVDEALVTGESIPETKRPGETVRGGTIVTDNPIVVDVGEEVSNTLSDIVDLLWDIQSSRSGLQRLVDRIATIVVPFVVVLAIVVAGAILVMGGTPTAAALVALTVLIVTCPCALGLATPLAIAAGIRDTAKRGLVVTSSAVFETARSIETVVLDKTGTLTDGEMAVRSIHTAGTSEETIVERAAALERASSHPIADAIVEYASETKLDDATAQGGSAIGARPDGGVDTNQGRNCSPVDGVESVGSIDVLDRGVREGEGVDGTIVGHPSLFEADEWTVPDAIASRATDVSQDGAVPVLVGWDGQVRGLIVVGDRPRADWEPVVDRLAADGKEVVVLTGDNPEAARRFRDHPGVAEVFGGVPPEAKAATVRRLSDRSKTAMVGDGSNDAPALAAADLGIAIGTGTDLAIDSADVVLVEERLDRIPELFELTAGTNSRIKQNLGWAFVYNTIAIPLAVTGVLNPLFAALAMATSSILVVSNSARSVK